MNAYIRLGYKRIQHSGIAIRINKPNCVCGKDLDYVVDNVKPHCEQDEKSTFRVEVISHYGRRDSTLRV
jgi:hypothetical protein